jgi:hypothetical protein
MVMVMLLVMVMVMMMVMVRSVQLGFDAFPASLRKVSLLNSIVKCPNKKEGAN